MHAGDEADGRFFQHAGFDPVVTGRRFDFEAAARFTALLAASIENRPFPEGTLLNVNAPGVPSEQLGGAAVTRLGKRIYRDKLELEEEDAGGRRRRRYRIYGDEPHYHREEGTDFAAIAEDLISVTPLHFDLTDVGQMEEIASWDLSQLLREAATST
jgi:5'-nucleotidase